VDFQAYGNYGFHLILKYIEKHVYMNIAIYNTFSLLRLDDAPSSTY
jgi:hypothetical protein